MNGVAVSNAGDVREVTDTISGEHTVFVLRSFSGSPLAQPWENNTLVSVPEDVPGEIWVHTGDQFGPYSVTCRLLDGPPGDPAALWEDVVELSINAPDAIVATEMIDGCPVIPLTDEPGEYRLRVSARGRVDKHDYPDDDEENQDDPIEWYLLEAWPAPIGEVEVIRLTSALAEAELHPPPPLVIPEGEAGIAASRRIGRDVDGLEGARLLSGVTGSVHVQRTVPGTRRKLFLICAHLVSWSTHWTGLPGWSSVAGPHELYELSVPIWVYSGKSADQLTGSRGYIEYIFIEVERPHRAIRELNWHLRTSRGPEQPFQSVPILDKPTVVAVELTQSRDATGEPQTTIDICHDGLPVEWLEDMELYWNFQLAIAEHARFGVSG